MCIANADVYKHISDHSLKQIKINIGFILAFGDCVVDFAITDTLEQQFDCMPEYEVPTKSLQSKLGRCLKVLVSISVAL